MDLETYKKSIEAHKYALTDNGKLIVLGFDETTSGNAGRCRVLLVDGSSEWVPIDGKDRITINGRKYGRSKWHH